MGEAGDLEPWSRELSAPRFTKRKFLDFAAVVKPIRILQKVACHYI